jgi:hypothetical protein
MKFNSSVILFAIIFFLQACASTNITSNKMVGYNKKPKKIFILTNNTSQTNKFCTTLARNFLAKFNEKDIKTAIYIRDSFSLETQEDVDKKINDYNPEALFVLQQTESHSTNGRIDGGTFEITLIDTETHKPVWKSEIQISAQYGLDDSINKTIDAVFRKLAEDNII